MGIFESTIGPLLLLIPAPILCLLLAFLTTSTDLTPTLGGFTAYVGEHGFLSTLHTSFIHTLPTQESVKFLLGFNLLALVLYKVLPGLPKNGPLTENGHLPVYTENGLAHCIVFTTCFLVGSDLVLGLFKLTVIWDTYAASIGTLNFFGLAFCVLLYFKGLYFPSGPDAGSSGKGLIFDYYWGTELYPRFFNVDVKMFVNCRFSMTYWMLAGVSFTAKSMEMHGSLDPGVLFCSLSQYIYLFKFFLWEIGYMRSIDIIVDRAGFYETWGCLVFVPSMYTLHTRILVHSPSMLSWPEATALFVLSISGVLINFWADAQRQHFREVDGKCLVWGKKPVFIEATYQAKDSKTGKMKTHHSLLLASGFWGAARHFQYLFELIAAWSWGLLAGVRHNGVLPLFYGAYLTLLLIHRAQRDEDKCLAKYGDGYRKYMGLVKYKIIPGVY